MDLKFTPAATDPVALITGAAARGLAIAAEYVLEQANRTVPYEEHILEGSGKASVSDDGLTAAISYDTPYAVAVHEDLTARHDSGRHAKWLELTLAKSGDQVARILADAVRGAL